MEWGGVGWVGVELMAYSTIRLKLWVIIILQLIVSAQLLLSSTSKMNKWPAQHISNPPSTIRAEWWKQSIRFSLISLSRCVELIDIEVYRKRECNRSCYTQVAVIICIPQSKQWYSSPSPMTDDVRLNSPQITDHSTVQHSIAHHIRTKQRKQSWFNSLVGSLPVLPLIGYSIS
jgi:hypothetical protein